MAVRWLEPRIIMVNGVLRKRYAAKRTAAVRLRVPARIVRLYVPYLPGQPIVSDSIRAIMKKHRVQADFPPPVDGGRGSLLFDFHVRDYPKEDSWNPMPGPPAT